MMITQRLEVIGGRYKFILYLWEDNSQKQITLQVCCCHRFYQTVRALRNLRDMANISWLNLNLFNLVGKCVSIDGNSVYVNCMIC